MLTNTPPRSAQSRRAGMQGIALMEPILAKAARKLGVDQVAIRRINAPEGKAPFGPPQCEGKRQLCHQRIHQGSARPRRGAVQMGREEARSPSGAARRCAASACRSAAYVGGSIGFDGLFVIKPDGRIYIQSGIGNLGTESVSDVHRVAAEILGVPWEKCEITWGNTAKNLPWTCASGGSQTTHAMTRAAHAAAMDAKKKLQEIAAKDLGGKPEDYEVANERVFRKGGGAGMSWRRPRSAPSNSAASTTATSCPRTSTRFTEASATALAGQGLLAVGRGQLSARRPDAFLRRQLRRSRSRRRNRQVSHPRFPGRRRRRHRDPSPRAGRPGSRPLDAGHRPRDRPEVGLRPALRPAAGQAVPPQQAADDSGCARRTCSGPRWTFPIRKRRSARAASASRRWAAGAAPF